MQQVLKTEQKLHTFSSYDIIPLRQDTLWLLKRGVVKTLTWNKEGELMTLGYWGSEDVVGQPLSQIEPYQIKCLTLVEACSFPVQQCNWLSEGIRRYIQQTEDLLYIIRSERIHQRLIKILIWLSQKFGREVAQGKLIELRLTHQDLAEVVGTTRVTVTRLLNQFEQQGMILRPRRHFIVLRSLLFTDIY